MVIWNSDEFTICSADIWNALNKDWTGINLADISKQGQMLHGCAWDPALPEGVLTFKACLQKSVSLCPVLACRHYFCFSSPDIPLRVFAVSRSNSLRALVRLNQGWHCAVT